METITVYQGSVAQQACQAILAANSNNALDHTKYDQPVEGINIKSAGFWEEDGKWIAYDNSTYDCWVDVRISLYLIGFSSPLSLWMQRSTGCCLIVISMSFVIAFTICIKILMVWRI